MVSPSYYPDGRRYSRLDPTYGYPERQQRRSHSSEARTSTMTERESETDTPPRKRIAVACGRCRKRKIRCSGDTGNGHPCQNCKAAGAESCMFLRVASTEAPWVQTATPEFAYELKAARAYQAQQAMVSPLTASPPHYASEMHDGLHRYPPTSAGYSSYGGGGKYYSSAATMPSWSSHAGYSDDGTGAVDYGAAAMGYSYPYQSHDPGYYYRMSAKAAAATSAADLYVSADAAAGYGYGGAGAASLVHRPAAAASVQQSEGSNFSLSTVAASLPHAGGSGGGDRLLPNPASRLPNTNVLAYRTDGGSGSGTSAPSYAASSSTKSSGSPVSQTSPTSAASEMTTGYSASSVAGSGSYESSPVTAYPPPAHTLPSMAPQQQHPHHHHNHRVANVADMAGYPPPPPSTAGSGDSIFSVSDASLRTHGSASDLSYKYTDGSSGSSSSSAGRRGSGGTASSGGSLSNGQQYTVTTPSVGMYAAAVAGHGRHHVSQYMISEDAAAEHHASRRSAGGLSAS